MMYRVIHKVSMYFANPRVSNLQIQVRQLWGISKQTLWNLRQCVVAKIPAREWDRVRQVNGSANGIHM